MNLSRFFFGWAVAFALSGLFGCSDEPCVRTDRHHLSIPPGMLAVSLQANPAIDAFIVPGKHVDILLTDKTYVTTTVLQDLEVAAFEPQESGSEGIVTLLTSPKEAVKLIVAVEEGRIHLAERTD